MTAPRDTSLLEFPCAFPIKVMGVHTDDFAQQIVAVVQVHAPDFAAETVAIRESSGGKYLSLTLTLQAQSQAQLDALYRALTGHPAVKFVL